MLNDELTISKRTDKNISFVNDVA